MASKSSNAFDASTVADFAKLIAGLDSDAAALVPITDALDERIRTSQNEGGASAGAASEEGVPLLALKNDTLLSYLHHLVVLTAHRLRGHSLTDAPGSELVENLVRLRLVLDKARPLESKMRYRIDKAVRAAEEEERGSRSGSKKQKASNGQATADGASGSELGDEDDEDDDDGEEEEEEDDDDDIDPLAFRPNPAALMAASKQSAAAASSRASSSKDTKRKGKSVSRAPEEDDEDEERGGVYRPPKLAPVPYDPDTVSRRKEGKEDRLPGQRNAALLADLSFGLSSNPYELSSAGLGGAGRNTASSSQASARAKALRRMEEYEEENFTRLVMKKKDAKRRRRDEEAVALGGAGLDSANRRAGRLGAGLDEEFGDLLRGFSGGQRKAKRRSSASGGGGDGYDALRNSAVKRVKVSSGTLSGSHSGPSSAKDLFRSGGGGRPARSQFSKDVAKSRKRARQ